MKTLDARVLAALRDTPVHLPPSDLAAQLGVTLAQIEAALAGWRAAGFDIETKPGLGCRLLAAPDRLIADDLHARLGESLLAREILVFEETSSTSDVAARLGREGRSDVVVFAERQTAGRGRFGRRWESADHAGLWFSLLLRPAWPLAHWPRLTTWAGIAVASVVEATLQKPAGIKWPNDVVVAGKKVAGILTESAQDVNGAPFAVVGIGLNVNQLEFPSELAVRAASLRQFTTRPPERSALAAALLHELALRLPATGDDFPALVAEAARRSVLLGQRVSLQAGLEQLAGIAEGLDPEGNLLLRLADGSLRRMIAGEVTSQTPESVPVG